VLIVHLKKKRDKPVKNGHPWIFSGSIEKIEGDPVPGEACRVLSADGSILGCGYYNKASAITVRMLTRDDTPFSGALLHERIEHAVALRRPILQSSGTDSCRLVNAEGDFLPGLIVDRYNNGLCVQILTAGMERMRSEIVSALKSVCAPAFLYERSDTEASGREGLQPRDGVVSGALPDPLLISENGITVRVDPGGGQKTGFYFDQRENRLLARSYAQGKRCLDCFSYNGGFTINLLMGGAASVTAVDISRNAVARCRENSTLNQYDGSRASFVQEDVFRYLRSEQAAYDLVVLDPPKFARHRGEVEKAARGYKDINFIAMKRIAAPGMLFTFSCSNAVDSKLFRQIVFAAAVDAQREVQVLGILSAGPDHPVNLSHPEGDYLKGLLLRIER
jgi:23S rRNA (cytosine1962-C5)-methyltransferase